MREKAKISQAVFAAYLNTSVSAVQKWEIGKKKPSGIALKLLNIVERNGLDVLVWDDVTNSPENPACARRCAVRIRRLRAGDLS